MEISCCKQWRKFWRNLLWKQYRRVLPYSVHSTAVGISVGSQNSQRNGIFGSPLHGYHLINIQKLLTLQQISTTKSTPALFVVKRSQLINQADYRTGGSMDTLICSQPKITTENNYATASVLRHCRKNAETFMAYKSKQWGILMWLPSCEKTFYCNIESINAFFFCIW